MHIRQDKKSCILFLPFSKNHTILNSKHVIIRANKERFMVDDMCEALDELIKDRWEEVMKDEIEKIKRLAETNGIEQGEQQKILALIQKKIKKGKSVAQIADELEKTEETILPPYNRLKEEGV